MTLEGRRILIDGSMATSGGGFTYLVNIVPVLAGLAPRARFLLVIGNRELADAIPSLPNVEVRLIPSRGLAGRLAFLVRQAAAIAREWGADLYFSAAEYAPLRAPCPVVVCLRNPNVFTELDQGWGRYQRFRLGTLRRMATYFARRAARVVFVSEDSARWMGDAAGLSREQRVVVHHGMDPAGWRARGQGGASHPSGILSVSTIYRYKNFVRLIDAYGELVGRVQDLPDLTIVGFAHDTRHFGEMQAARDRLGSLGQRIHLTGPVSYLDVAAWYEGARLFVFPSYLETFGHPMLEAMASGLPIVAADIPVFREIAGDAALYADPHSTTALAEAMAKVLDDESLRTDLIERGAGRLEVFSWRASAERLVEVLAGVLGRLPST
jgi:glycosyltransferase involved in cell wall biosynthesis